MFCGEAIGEAAPPMLEASAIPRMSAFEKLESEGRLRSSGLGICQASTLSLELGKRTCMMEKHKTGEATLLIHMLSIIATNILVTNTVLGLVPALLRTNVAIILAI